MAVEGVGEAVEGEVVLLDFDGEAELAGGLLVGAAGRVIVPALPGAADNCPPLIPPERISVLTQMVAVAISFRYHCLKLYPEFICRNAPPLS